MKLFSQAQIDEVNRIAEKSKAAFEKPKSGNVNSLNDELHRMSKSVEEYFKDSKAILITTKSQLHDYISNIIECGYFGIDTETTGLDRYNDYIVGSSLYYPGGVECYIPNKHRVPIFENLCKDQLTYEEVHEEFQRLVDAKCKAIFANADFDLSMISKDYKVDMCSIFYYDVLLAWRCLKENEPRNDLKSLYNKYVLKGKGDPKKFSDFFSPQLFPYCKPAVARLYAANDAKITFELFKWQLPFVTPSHIKCQRNHLEDIANILWNLEFPLVTVCQKMHKYGMYFDTNISDVLRKRYADSYNSEVAKLQDMVQVELDKMDYKLGQKRPFNRGKDFNPTSPPQVKYLCYDVLHLPKSGSGSTNKEVLKDFNHPITNQILKVRSFSTLINTFVDKLPRSVWPDHKIHANFKQIGANTGRFSSESPNMQNIPSRSKDIRHQFRATPSMNVDVECESDNALITVTLSKFDSVYLDDGSCIKVKDLKHDQIVRLHDNANKCDVYKHVLCISNVEGTCNVNLSFV